MRESIGARSAATSWLTSDWMFSPEPMPSDWMSPVPVVLFVAILLPFLLLLAARP